MCTTLVDIYPFERCIFNWVDFTALKSQVQNEETAVNMNNALVEIKV